MLSDVRVKDYRELFRTPIVQQTAFWSVVKNKLGWDTVAVNFKSRTEDLFCQTGSGSAIDSDMLMLIQNINNDESIAYVPYGPELEPDDQFQGVFLEELSESLRSYLPKNCILIRYDLCWESYWAKEDDFYDPDGNWMGEPGRESQELRFNIGTINWNFKKSHSNILPVNTIYINLTSGLNRIMERMRPKTRYNINLSLRRGVAVRSAGMESIGVWYELYKETALRNNIYLNDIKYFEAILTSRAENTHSPAEVKLLIAELNGIPLAAMFLVIAGNRGSYLYGASSGHYRNYMATYALQWEAIKISKARGCTEYDMFGTSPNPGTSHPLYGLYKFKTGFGGELYHSLGCWDYPLDNERYNAFRSSELNIQGFHMH
ncbi:MAG: peptidoglycan bridge formation glycyltransferase FemA/FemB family protein [Bacteroidales bacterium]|nr:peptidoglycan bridge formation glycyltransferase FemA/FemB family protein [Bacteroidales bacterium]